MAARGGGRTHRRRRISIGRTLLVALGAAVVFWCVGLFVFTSYIPEPASAPEQQRTDAIVVLTGGSGRVSEGLDLLEKGKAGKLFVSGVYRGVDVAALLKLARQIPGEIESRIALGYSADNTEGNARETAEWMSAQGFRSLRLVTASYHMPRSLLEFRRAMPAAKIVIHPVHPARFKLEEWWRWPGTARLIVMEYNKYLLALANGVAGVRPVKTGPS